MFIFLRHNHERKVTEENTCFIYLLFAHIVFCRSLAVTKQCKSQQEVPTFPRAADVVAISKTNISLSAPLAATDMGLVPSVLYDKM